MNVPLYYRPELSGMEKKVCDVSGLDHDYCDAPVRVKLTRGKGISKPRLDSTPEGSVWAESR